MSAKLTYAVFGGKATALELIEPGARVPLPNIPDGVSVLFGVTGGNVRLTVGPPGEHMERYLLVDGTQEQAIDIPAGPVCAFLLLPR